MGRVDNPKEFELDQECRIVLETEISELTRAFKVQELKCWMKSQLGQTSLKRLPIDKLLAFRSFLEDKKRTLFGHGR